MTQRCRVNFVLPLRMRSLCEPARQALVAAGHSIADYDALDALTADRPAMAGMDVLVAMGYLTIDGAIMKAAPRLRAIVTPFIGTEGFDHRSAAELGIVIANGQTVENYTSMAEATILLVLAALYDLPGAQRLLRENLRRPDQRSASMLMRKTVGIVGFGKIAQSVAERLSTWGVKLTTYVRTPRPLPSYISAVPFEQLLAESDVVIVLTDLRPESLHLLDGPKLALVKPDVVFVNTARGAIVDEPALVELARQRPAMRIALDVFETEPLPKESPLRDIPNAVLTPHILGHTVDSAAAGPLLLRENIMAVVEGRAPPCLRNPEAMTNPDGRWSRGLA